MDCGLYGARMALAAGATGGKARAQGTPARTDTFTLSGPPPSPMAVRCPRTHCDSMFCRPSQCIGAAAVAWPLDAHAVDSGQRPALWAESHVAPQPRGYVPHQSYHPRRRRRRRHLRMPSSKTVETRHRLRHLPSCPASLRRTEADISGHVVRCRHMVVATRRRRRHGVS